MADDDVRRVHNAIQVGMTIGESNQQIASRVVGTGALKHTDGTTELTRNQVAAVSRTAVMHIAAQARAAWMQENTDVITAEKFVATLDNRTTPICRALDGNTYEVGKGPVPPLHFGCRSVRVPQFGGEELGNRPAKPVTQKMLLAEYAMENNLGKITSRDDLPRGHKGSFDAFERKRIRELTGQVAVSTNYQTWLSDQSNAFQDDTLGIARAKLFRSGGLTLDKFVTRNGDQITLKDLAAKHADAFRAAGLDPEKYL
jgi:SPP1 gp7 family putative phage head morphogenesis protein